MDSDPPRERSACQRCDATACSVKVSTGVGVGVGMGVGVGVGVGVGGLKHGNTRRVINGANLACLTIVLQGAKMILWVFVFLN